MVSQALRCVSHALRRVSHALRCVSHALRCVSHALRCVSHAVKCVSHTVRVGQYLYKIVFKYMCVFVNEVSSFYIVNYIFVYLNALNGESKYLYCVVKGLTATLVMSCTYI